MRAHRIFLRKLEGSRRRLDQVGLLNHATKGISSVVGSHALGFWPTLEDGGAFTLLPGTQECLRTLPKQGALWLENAVHLIRIETCMSDRVPFARTLL